MQSIVVSVVVFVLVALLLVCVVLILASLKKPGLSWDSIPPCEKLEPLSSREKKLLRDLQKLGEKHSMDVFPHVMMGDILRPREGFHQSREWARELRGYSADFVLCDSIKLKPRLVILSEEGDAARGEEQNVVRMACEQAKLPVLMVRDYNLSGLEKAIQDKLAPPVRQAAQQALSGEELLEDMAAV